jgi:hypothetical protein
VRLVLFFKAGLQLQARFFWAARAPDSESGAIIEIVKAAATMAVTVRRFILPPWVVRA